MDDTFCEKFPVLKQEKKKKKEKMQAKLMFYSHVSKWIWNDFEKLSLIPWII